MLLGTDRLQRGVWIASQSSSKSLSGMSDSRSREEIVVLVVIDQQDSHRGLSHRRAPDGREG